MGLQAWSQKLKEAESHVLIIGLVLWFSLPEELALEMCLKADRVTCVVCLLTTCTTRPFWQ